MKLNHLFEEDKLTYAMTERDIKSILTRLNLAHVTLSIDGSGGGSGFITRSFFVISENWDDEKGLDYAMPYYERTQAFLKLFAKLLKRYVEDGFAVDFTSDETDGVAPDKIYDELVRCSTYDQYYSNEWIEKLSAPKELLKIYFNVTGAKRS